MLTVFREQRERPNMKLFRKQHRIILLGIVFIGILFLLYPYVKQFIQRTFFPPTVSVVMPTYNRANLLPRAIESILHQTFRDFELIIVDDGSTDHSKEVLQSYADLDDRIIVLYNSENKGISYSRNRGNNAARGKYIAIMDSDDISLPKRLEKSVDFLEKHPDITAVNSTYTKTSSPKTNNWVPKKRLDILMNLGNYFTHLALVRRDFIEQHNIHYDEAFISSEDYDFWRQVIFAGGQLAMINEPLLTLRRHKTNTPEYYQAIKDNRKIISAQFLERFGISKEDAFRGNRCDLLYQMRLNNPRVQLVDQETLDFTYRKECTNEQLPIDSLYLKHTDYVDNLIPDGPNKFKRQRTGETATVMYQSPSLIVLRWENGKEETFEHQENAWALTDKKI